MKLNHVPIHLEPACSLDNRKVFKMKILSIIVCFVMLTVSNLQAKDWHALQTDKKFRWVEVVFHILIPEVINQAGVELKTALGEYLGNDTIISRVPNLEQDENDSLQACYLYEYTEMVVFTNANLTPLEKRGEIDVRCAALKSEIPINLQKILKYWGMKRNIP